MTQSLNAICEIWLSSTFINGYTRDGTMLEATSSIIMSYSKILIRETAIGKKNTCFFSESKAEVRYKKRINL